MWGSAPAARNEKGNRARGWKTIRYRLSLNHKPCQLEIGCRYLRDSFRHRAIKAKNSQGEDPRTSERNETARERTREPLTEINSQGEDPRTSEKKQPGRGPENLREKTARERTTQEPQTAREETQELQKRDKIEPREGGLARVIFSAGRGCSRKYSNLHRLADGLCLR